MRSSTTRKRPSSSQIAATVISGFHAMADIIAGGAVAERSLSPTAGDAQPVLGCTSVPRGIAPRQIEFGDGRIVEVGDAVPGVCPHAIRDRSVISNQIGRGALR